MNVYLVVVERGGLHGTYLDRDLAERVAEAVEGVIAELPIVADYRQNAPPEFFASAPGDGTPAADMQATFGEDERPEARP